jgi:hypothetical protein
MSQPRPNPTPNTQRARGNPQRNNPLPQNENKDVGRVPSAINEVPDVKDEDLQSWLTRLYDVTNIRDQDLQAIWNAYSYKGFNREEVLKQLFVIFNDIKMATHAIIAIAMRGPQAASTIKMPSGRALLEMGIPASGGQGTKVLTCNKIQAATADLAAFYLKKMNAPKRLNVECPGWLQFPSAGSIKMPDNYRRMHLEFTKAFSEVIGGTFQPQIYDQMVANSYLAPNLKLFEVE